MNIQEVAVPEVYKSSQDFRFFLKWFELALQRIQHDTENLVDLYDPLRCPAELLWMLADTIGFKYDDRLPVAFNRLVLLYFMSMIRHKGSKDGVTLAAETNLAQYNILLHGQENDILYNRLEDTSIPVNSVYVTPHTDKGYIDVVYFSTKTPIDACIEYVRPVGMYMFQHAGVRYDARTKISVDARLTNSKDLGVSIGPTHVGHYSREDYARLQKMYDEDNQTVNKQHKRASVHYRNTDAEIVSDAYIDPGYRALYSLQISNNDHIVKSLLDPIFSLGYGPQDVTTQYPDSYLKPLYQDKPAWNLQYNRAKELSITTDVYTVDQDKTSNILNPRPAVNPIMMKVGDAISTSADNTTYLDTSSVPSSTSTSAE